MTDQLRLEVNGISYEGWLTVEIERALDSFAHRFSLRYLDRWQQDPWPIRKGAACALYWGSELLVTGFINRASFRASQNEWMLTAEGRSSTCDLVDCSATHPVGSWYNRTATQIVTDLVKPYGLKVIYAASEPDTQIFSRFAIEVGESVHSAIDRLCKVRALVPITSPGGAVQLLEVGTGSPVALDLTKVIVQQYDEDDSERFSAYLLAATGVGSVAEAYVQAEVTDPGVSRFRPLVVIGDAPAGSDQSKLRAQWECNIRAGRSERPRYTMRGATDVRGLTYTHGRLYSIRDDLLGINDTFVCARAVLRVSERECITELEFARPEAYASLAYPNKLLVKQTKKGKALVKKTRRLR